MCPLFFPTSLIGSVSLPPPPPPTRWAPSSYPHRRSPPYHSHPGPPTSRGGRAISAPSRSDQTSPVGKPRLPGAGCHCRACVKHSPSDEGSEESHGCRHDDGVRQLWLGGHRRSSGL